MKEGRGDKVPDGMDSKARGGNGFGWGVIVMEEPCEGV